MYRATDSELNSVIGIVNSGYKIINVRRKSGEFSDSDSYGVAVGMNENGSCVTWLFHFYSENEFSDFYWGHYFRNIKDSDFETRQ